MSAARPCSAETGKEAKGSAAEPTVAGYRVSSQEHVQAVVQCRHSASGIVSEPNSGYPSCSDESGVSRSASDSESADDPLIGRLVGRFLIESVIASGGMGTVYRAQQLKPVKRYVALKTIRTGQSNDATIRRFHAERQALALLSHSDIAQVFEADTTPDGQPYFAMEYCHGLPIDQYCENRQLNIQKRVQLIVRVAKAVEQAHRRGIIHRDLKPSNILVADDDGSPVVKIIDFGVAKFTDDAWQPKFTDATCLGELVGTPAYMSPEQSDGSEIDGRADVFAIGAILFRLLTGSTPLRPPAGAGIRLSEILCRLQQFEPELPTQRLLQESSTDREFFAKNAGLKNGRTLLSCLKGDLNWITLKAIESDRTRRYATAQDLADDLMRFLNHQPVNAAAPGILYRSRKLYQRRKAAVLGSGAVLLTIATSAAIGAVVWWNLESAARAETKRVAVECESLLDQAEESRLRAGMVNSNAGIAFTAAETALAKAESMLENQPTLTSLNCRWNSVRRDLTADKTAIDLIQKLNNAQERATQIDATQRNSAFGKIAAIEQLGKALAEWGVAPVVTPAETAADCFLECPLRVQSRIVETLDFIINEDPIGAGLFLQEQSGRITVLDTPEGGAADCDGRLQHNDRILAVGAIDLTSSDDPRQKMLDAYRELHRPPGTSVEVIAVRPGVEPFRVELTCQGDTAFWARDVLRSLDPNTWRSTLRDAVLNADLPSLRHLAQSPEANDQFPFSLIQLSSSLFLLERAEQAIQFLERTQSRHPSNFWVNQYLGTALTVASRPAKPDEGLRFLTAAVSLRPKSVGARMNLFDGYLLVSDFDAAMEQITVAIQLCPEDDSLKRRRLDLQTKMKRQKNDLLSPNETHESAANSTKPPWADAQDDEVISTKYLSPDSVDFWEAKARNFALKGQRAMAFQTLAQAAERFPNNPLLLRTKGVLLCDLQDFVAARVILADAARQCPNDAAARFYFGYALQFSGDSQAAIPEYQAALFIRPDYDHVHQYLDPLLTLQPEESGAHSVPTPQVSQ